MTAQNKYTKHILSFFEERPYINIALFEQTAGLPLGTIAFAKYYDWDIPKSAIWNIMIELSKMGVPGINGYSLLYYEDIDCFIAKKKLEPAKSEGVSVYKEVYIKKTYTTIDDLYDGV